jgi:hypothetical protein
MELMIISLACNVGYLSIKTIYENKDIIKKYLHHHNMEKVEEVEKVKEIIDDIIPPLNTPINEEDDTFNNDDVYNISETNSELSKEEIKEDIKEDDNELRKSVAEKILETTIKKPTILKRKSYTGFNPSSLLEKLQRSITPSRLQRSKTPEKVIINNHINKNAEFDRFLTSILKFIHLEMKSNDFEDDDLQDYKIFTKKLLYVLNKNAKPIKNI